MMIDITWSVMKLAEIVSFKTWLKLGKYHHLMNFITILSVVSFVTKKKLKLGSRDYMNRSFRLL